MLEISKHSHFADDLKQRDCIPTLQKSTWLVARKGARPIIGKFENQSRKSTLNLGIGCVKLPYECMQLQAFSTQTDPVV